MNRAYWDGVSKNYRGEVLSVYHHDHLHLVQNRIASAGKSQPAARAADLGCGVGHFTPALAKAFAHVDACDLSSNGVDATRQICSPFPNVTVHQLDLATDLVPFEPVDFALCVNVLIMPSLDERLRAWRAVTNQVASGGTLLLVVPSLESVQMELFRAVDAHIEDGQSCAEAQHHGHTQSATIKELQQGVHQLDGLPTKHYLRAELEDMLPAHEFDIQELLKIDYPAEPQASLAPSWDWLALAKRR
ncbi:Methyltransferase domain family [Verrucomicrobiia bacterium DG1235]|nr:Methyltransferase domain family [Verrucomicrobiae bacterium DG1235]